MKINMVIVDPNPDRAIRAGRCMAAALRKDFRDWELHAHARKPDDVTGVDDAYARYSG